MHSKTLLLLPQGRPREVHFRPLTRNKSSPAYPPTEATPLSPGSVKFVHLPLVQLLAAPAASDINFTAVIGGPMGGSPIGIPFLMARMPFFQMQRSITRKFGTKRQEFSQFLKQLPSGFESWKRKPFMNELICAKSESFPGSLSTSFKLHVLIVRK